MRLHHYNHEPHKQLVKSCKCSLTRQQPSDRQWLNSQPSKHKKLCEIWAEQDRDQTNGKNKSSGDFLSDQIYQTPP